MLKLKDKTKPLALGGALVIAILITAAPAQAANPACGSTVTHDVKLTSDMDCSASNTDGLEIGKAGITINLNGHKLIGPDSGSYYGIYNGTGYDKVTIENGTVEGYEYGILSYYATGLMIEHIHAGMGSAGEYSGFYVEYGQNGEINHSSADVDYASTNYPIYLYENTNFNVLNTKIVNPNSGSYGLFDDASLDTIDNVKSNGGYYGLYIEEPVKGSKITNSTANGNSEEGFYIYENYPQFYYATTVSHNTANNNGDYGFYADLAAAGKKNHATGNATANCFHVKCSH